MWQVPLEKPALGASLKGYNENGIIFAFDGVARDPEATSIDVECEDCTKYLEIPTGQSASIQRDA